MDLTIIVRGDRRAERFLSRVANRVSRAPLATGSVPINRHALHLSRVAPHGWVPLGRWSKACLVPASSITQGTDIDLEYEDAATMESRRFAIKGLQPL
eukprot:1039100-Lingulodinium_polyedra.AAC.2